MKAKKDTVLVKSLQNREIPRTELESRMACLRKELRRKSWIYAIVVAFGVIGIVAFGLLSGINVSDNETLSIFFFVLAIVALLGVIIFHIVFKLRSKRQEIEYETYYHYYFGLYLLDGEISDLAYSEYGVGDSDLRMAFYGTEYLDLHPIDSICFGNYQAGTYRNVSFSGHEMKISQEINEHRRETFNGQWISFECPKEFPASLQIIEKGFEIAKKDAPLGVFKKNKKEPQSVPRYAELGEKEFCKTFRCWCVEESGAVGDLVRSVSNAMLALHEAVHGRVLVSFEGPYLTIMIDGGFTMKPLTSEAAFQRNVKVFTEQYHAIFQFVDRIEQIYG